VPGDLDVINPIVKANLATLGRQGGRRRREL
jgi:hypothetical protein